MNIKKNGTVIVLSGKDKGVKGKVLVAMPSENKVIVEKVNVATCHTKPRRQGETGGIVKRETPIRACKVALFCEKCGKGNFKFFTQTFYNGIVRHTFASFPFRNSLIGYAKLLC